MKLNTWLTLWHMHEGYGSHVCVVCLYSCYMHLENWYLCAVFNIFCIVWISMKTLCSKTLVTFADHLCYLSFFINS